MPVVRQDWSSTDYKAMYVPNDDVDLKSSPLVLVEDELEVTLGFQEIDRYALVVTAELEISPKKLLDWQMSVHRKIKAIKQKKLDEDNREKELRYDSAMATYENRIAELKAQAINDLLQGQSEAFNREIILTEFKRACLAMLTKEFSACRENDFLTRKEAMGQREVCFQYRRLGFCETEGKVACETEEESCCRDEAVNRSDFTEEGFKLVGCSEESGKRTICIVETMSQPVKYPLVCLSTARDKGRYIQFLEQAFEWPQLAYLCYPYFWTPPPKWIDLMNRSECGSQPYRLFESRLRESAYCGDARV